MTHAAELDPSVSGCFATIKFVNAAPCSKYLEHPRQARPAADNTLTLGHAVLFAPPRTLSTGQAQGVHLAVKEFTLPHVHI